MKVADVELPYRQQELRDVIIAGGGETRRSRARVFKSGNSLAVRIPAGTKLAAGMEMDLTIEDGTRLSLQPVDAPKRKFNIDKVWGSATNLTPIDPDNRWFEERELNWGPVEPEAS
jgi:antitoxin VapB